MKILKSQLKKLVEEVIKEVSNGSKMPDNLDDGMHTIQGVIRREFHGDHEAEKLLKRLQAAYEELKNYCDSKN